MIRLAQRLRCPSSSTTTAFKACRARADALCGAKTRLLCSESVSSPDTHSGAARRIGGSGSFRPRRTVMYVPAADERKTRKAAGLLADTLVFDLEDAIATSQKEHARRRAREAIAYCKSQGTTSEMAVRVNGFESGMMQQDIEAVFPRSRDLSCDPMALMLPKVDTEEHLHEFDLALAVRSNGLPPLPLFIMIESPLGIINLRQICTYGTEKARNFRLSALVVGPDDLLARLGGERTKGAEELLYARQCVVMHARAFGLDPIDVVDIDFKDLDGLRVQSEEGARMGYCGKQVIHPNQIPTVQSAFSPSKEKVDWASGLIREFHQHQESGKGAFVYQGNMIDRPLLLQAENIVQLQEAIEANTGV